MSVIKIFFALYNKQIKHFLLRKFGIVANVKIV